LLEHPRWPSAGTVAYHFGSWSDGLLAAGLATLVVEHELPRRERVATAVALRAAGESVRSIAEQLGVHLRTAHRYLAAGVCPGCGGPALCGEHAWTAHRATARPRRRRRSSRRCTRTHRYAWAREEALERLAAWALETFHEALDLSRRPAR
jgi:IS30 family transposase